MATFQELSEAIQKGNAPKAKELTSALLSEKNGAGDILNKGLLDGMDKVGQRFKCNEIYIPEVLIAARAMNASMDILKPELVKAGVKPIGKMLIGTVKGDLHDIGKNLVKMMAQGAGIEVVDLGIDVSADKFIQGLKDNPDAKAIGMSALLTTTMTGMKDVIDRFEKEGLRKKVKFMVGGAPLTDQYAKEIGADGYAPDAASASEKVKAFEGVSSRARRRTLLRAKPLRRRRGVVSRLVSSAYLLRRHFHLERDVGVPEPGRCGRRVADGVRRDQPGVHFLDNILHAAGTQGIEDLPLDSDARYARSSPAPFRPEATHRIERWNCCEGTRPTR